MTHDRDTAAGETLAMPPWEERGRYGLLNALYLTAKDVLLSPGRFFLRMLGIPYSILQFYLLPA